MKQCTFLSMQNLDAFECYDHLLFDPLASYGWEATEVSWRSEPVDWNRFDVVLVRSPWDYQEDPDHFMEVLEKIDQSSAHLENSLKTIRWNLDKRYMNDMQEKGIPIVPTIWKETLDVDEIPSFFSNFDEEKLIIKPVISAGADFTYRIRKEENSQILQKISKVFADRPLMIQPFMQNIIDEGEFSLFYFGGIYSHAILKTPAAGDFRVQEEHGGKLQLIEPERELAAIGRQTMEMLPELPLYARVDFVRASDEKFVLMELELIEPSLYFNMDEESPRRFAKIFDQRMQHVAVK